MTILDDCLRAWRFDDERIYARYFRLVKQEYAPHCVLSPDCLFDKQRESVHGNRYRMVLRFHRYDNHRLPLLLSLSLSSSSLCSLCLSVGRRYRRIDGSRFGEAVFHRLTAK